MTEQGLAGLWFFLLMVCPLVCHGLTQVPEPAQCLISGIFSLVQLPEIRSEKSCWEECFAEPDCHMAVVEKCCSFQCLLVNCLNQGNYSYPRNPSTQIRVYPKSTINNESWWFYQSGAYGLADEILRCSELMNYSSCQSGTPRFFYNSTTFRCERFLSGCGSSRNTFETQEACEALCNEKFRCYQPSQFGECRSEFSKFYYDMKTETCMNFTFSGCGSNGNIFSTVEECESLCAGVKEELSTTTNQPAPLTDRPAATVTISEEPAPPTKQPAEHTDLILGISIVAAIIVIVIVAVVYWMYRRQSQPQTISRNTLRPGRNLTNRHFGGISGMDLPLTEEDYGYIPVANGDDET